MPTLSQTGPALSRGPLTRLLAAISELGPWGPLLAELTFVAFLLLVTGLCWWIASGPVMRAFARRISAPVESLRPLRTAARSLIVFAAVGSLIGHFTELDLFTLVSGTIALIAIGFVALWSTLSNILCTILILVTRPFRIGDELSFPPDPFEGQVVDLTFFFTTLKAADCRTINVPNTMFFQRIVVRRATDVATPDLGEQLAKPHAAVIEPSATVDGK